MRIDRGQTLVICYKCLCWCQVLKNVLNHSSHVLPPAILLSWLAAMVCDACLCAGNCCISDRQLTGYSVCLCVFWAFSWLFSVWMFLRPHWVVCLSQLVTGEGLLCL